MSELHEDPQLVAQSRGQVMILPDEDELLLDIDSEADLLWYEQMKILVNREAEPGHRWLTETRRTSSRNGGTHIYVTIHPELVLWDLLDDPRVSPILNIALQACLGSDRKRELFSLLRILTGTMRPPTVLFEHRDFVR